MLKKKKSKKIETEQRRPEQKESKQKVILTHQSFRDAGGLEVFPDLEMIGIVETVTYNQQHSYESLIKEAHESLMEKARKMKGSYIFEVKQFNYVQPYKHEAYGQDYRIVGIAYGPKKK